MTKAGHSMDWCPEGWQRHNFAHHDRSHRFYLIDRNRQGRVVPSVMLMHEFPGISENLVQFANILALDFRVVVPSLFGRDGTPMVADSLKQICVRREVHVLARNAVSKSVGWLRDFVDEHVVGERNEPYGVIGMCISGNFALALAVDPRVAAAVVAQPSIPLWRSALGLSPDDRCALQARTDVQVQGYRFRHDFISPAAKLGAAEELLGRERMQLFVLNRPNWLAHSTLTGQHRDDTAVESVRLFLSERLSATP